MYIHKETHTHAYIYCFHRIISHIEVNLVNIRETENGQE